MSRILRSPFWLWGGLLCSALSCEPEREVASLLDSLRVMAVQKDRPYARPGDSVSLQILWNDGRRNNEAPARDVQIAWVSGCHNPASELYALCFAQLAMLAQTATGADAGTAPPSGAPLGFPTPLGFPKLQCSSTSGGGCPSLGFFAPAPAGPSSFDFQIPAEIIAVRPPPNDPTLPPWGLSYVFFAICAGELELDTSGESFPLRCRDASSGKLLGSDDFVAGYSAVYSYDEPIVLNTNPRVDGVEFGDISYLPAEWGQGTLCLGASCVPDAEQNAPALPEDPCSDPGVVCIDRCESDDCEQIPVLALVDSSQAQTDSVLAAQLGQQLSEQMWVNYYADGGEFESGTRLLSDAQRGWNEDHGAQFTAPAEPGWVNIWAISHDSRGGTDWARIRVYVR